MIKIEAWNARNSMAIAKFHKASAPRLWLPASLYHLHPWRRAHAPYPRPAGNDEIDYFGPKLIVHDLFRGSLMLPEFCFGNG